MTREDLYEGAVLLDGGYLKTVEPCYMAFLLPFDYSVFAGGEWWQVGAAGSYHTDLLAAEAAAFAARASGGAVGTAVVALDRRAGGDPLPPRYDRRPAAVCLRLWVNPSLHGRTEPRHLPGLAQVRDLIEAAYRTTAPDPTPTPEIAGAAPPPEAEAPVPLPAGGPAPVPAGYGLGGVAGDAPAALGGLGGGTFDRRAASADRNC